MCFYAMVHYKLHYVCVECRYDFKRHPAPAGHHVCPGCRGQLVCVGHDFAAPRRRDARAWSVVAAVLAAGLRYEGLEACGCGKDPAFRPRTRAQLRARRRVAARTGIPVAEALARRDAGVPETTAGR